jgi:hypothetical protein
MLQEDLESMTEQTDQLITDNRQLLGDRERIERIEGLLVKAGIALPTLPPPEGSSGGGDPPPDMPQGPGSESPPVPPKPTVSGRALSGRRRSRIQPVLSRSKGQRAFDTRVNNYLAEHGGTPEQARAALMRSLTDRAAEKRRQNRNGTLVPGSHDPEPPPVTH